MARKTKKRTRTNREVGGQVFQPKGREGDGRPWYVRWTLPDGTRTSERAMHDEIGADGRAKRRPAESYAEAEAALAALVTGAKSTAAADAARGVRAVPLRTFWKDEAEANAKARLSPRQFKNVKSQILRCADAFPGVPMCSIDRPAFEAYFTEIRAEGRHKAAAPDKPAHSGPVVPLSVATLTRNRVALSKVWDSAIERNAALTNPLRRITFGRGQERPAVFLTAEQLAKLRMHLSPTIAPLVTMLTETGGRFGEVVAMRWDQVAHDYAGVTFTRTKSGRTRFVPCSERAKETLTELHEGRVAPMTGEDLVFARLPRSHSYVLRTFREALAKAGLPETTRIHDLRHSLAAGMLQAGVSLGVVGQILGHSNLTVTSRYASHAPASLAVQAVAALEQAREAGTAAAKRTARRPRRKREAQSA
jgi:integrase